MRKVKKNKNLGEYNLKYLTLKLTNNCNLSCEMCGQYRANHRDSADELKIEEIEKILNSISSIEHVYLFGGEPLLYKKIIQLLNTLSKREMPCRITTNGVLLRKYSEELIKNNVRDVEISFDSHIKETYEKIRGKNVYDEVISGITHLLEEKERAKSQYPRISINAVVLPENYQLLMEMIDWINMKFPKLDGINFELPMSVYSDLGKRHTKFMKKNFGVGAGSWEWFENKELLFTKEEIKKIYSCIIKIRQEGNASIKGPDSFKGILYALDNNSKYIEKPCQYPFYTMAVLPNGDVTFCVDFPDYIIGNIYKSAIEEIWNGEKAQNFRNCIKLNENLPICERCPHRFEVIKKEKEKL